MLQPIRHLSARQASTARRNVRHLCPWGLQLCLAGPWGKCLQMCLTRWSQVAASPAFQVELQINTTANALLQMLLFSFSSYWVSLQINHCISNFMFQVENTWVKPEARTMVSILTVHLCLSEGQVMKKQDWSRYLHCTKKYFIQVYLFIWSDWFSFFREPWLIQRDKYSR